MQHIANTQYCSRPSGGRTKLPGRLCRIIIFISLFLCPAVEIAAAELLPPPFTPGEKLVFELKWTLVSAGKATLEVLPMIRFKQSNAYHFRLTARTNKILDRLYKVRDRIDAYTDTQVARTLYFAQKQRERNYRKLASVNFFWDRSEAQYHDLLKEKKRKPVPLMPGALDPLAVFYHARCLPLKEGMVMERPVTDGKKCVIGKATIIRRESVTVKAGTFDTFLMIPELKHIGGVFKKSENAKIEIWVTADRRKMPVKLRSEVAVGRFTAELISYQ